MNFDQTILNYAPPSNSTLARNRSKLVSIAGGAFLASPVQISSYRCNSYIKEKREEVFHE